MEELVLSPKELKSVHARHARDKIYQVQAQIDVYKKKGMDTKMLDERLHLYKEAYALNFARGKNYEWDKPIIPQVKKT